MLLRKALFPIILLSGELAFAQSFTTYGGIIPNDGLAIDFPIEVSGLVPPTIDTVAFGLETVCLNIDHNWVDDLDIRLVAPDGTSALLVKDNGWDTTGYQGTCFNVNADYPVSEGQPPYTGTFRPQGQMGKVNNGQVGNGTWAIRILDTWTGSGTGSLASATITFGDQPATWFNFTTSDLPIMVINTDTAIVNEPKVHGTMGVIDNEPFSANHLGDAFNGYHGHIGIEIRGNSSTMFPKLSYGFETWDSTGTEMEVPLLGMPQESDWVLCASYSDKSLLNNVLTFDLAQRMGHYAPRCRYVEVVLNGDYVGVYILMEKIKRDGDRVAIAKLQPQDTVGDDLTGGYILKIDWAQGSNSTWWASDFPPPNAGNGQVFKFLLDYPDQPQPAQAAYIEAYADSFEYALAGENFMDPQIGYRRFLDERSAIDYFLISEFGRNVDGYGQSTFLYKDKDSNGGKLVLGPLWDFDLAFGNSNYCDGSVVEGWGYQHAQVCPNDVNLPPFWWGRFLEDTAFTDSLRCRWENLRYSTLGTDRLDAWCDSMAIALAAGQQHNFAIWPIMGAWIWPNPQPVPATYAGEIQELKDWMHARWLWLDTNIPGVCDFSTALTEGPSQHLKAFPNPFTDRIDVMIDRTAAVKSCALIDALGRETSVNWSISPDGRDLSLIVPPMLAPGTYVLRVTTSTGIQNVAVVRERD